MVLGVAAVVFAAAGVGGAAADAAVVFAAGGVGGVAAGASGVAGAVAPGACAAGTAGESVVATAGLAGVVGCGAVVAAFVLAEALPLELWTWVLWVALPLEHGGVPPTHFLPATQGQLQLAAVVVLQLGSSSPGPLAWAFACGALAVEVGNPSCLPYMALWLLLLLLLLAWDWEVQSDWKCHCCTGHAGPAPYSPLALLGCSWLLLSVADPLPGPAKGLC